MADITQSNWNATDASNTTAAPDGAPEGMNPSGVNDTMRAMIGALKRWYNWTIPATTGGTTTAYTLTYSPAPGALADGMSHLVLFNATNGAAPTLNVNSLGAKAIHKYSNGAWGAVASGDLVANSVHRVAYNLADTTYRIVGSASPIGAAFLALANTFSALITMSGAAINEAQGADIASVAGITDIGAATGNYVKVTGTNTITGLGTIQAGTRRKVEFTGALLLTHNATSLILPGGASIMTAAGDVYEFTSEGSGNWRCTGYARPNGGGQVVATISGAVATGSTNLPIDDTIPQNTEGDEYMTCSITPKSASSILSIQVTFLGGNSDASTIGVALFQDSTAGALAAAFQSPFDVNKGVNIVFNHKMTAGTTSATTFKVRAGCLGTTTFNGISGGRIFGGVMASSIVINETLP